MSSNDSVFPLWRSAWRYWERMPSVEDLFSRRYTQCYERRLEKLAASLPKEREEEEVRDAIEAIKSHYRWIEVNGEALDEYFELENAARSSPEKRAELDKWEKDMSKKLFATSDST